MKIQLYWLLLAALLLLPGKADAANNKKPFVIPELQEWRGAQGMFTPTATSRIVYTGKDPSVARVANQFAEDYELEHLPELKPEDQEVATEENTDIPEIQEELPEKKGKQNLPPALDVELID